MSDMSDHPKIARRAVLYRMVMPGHTCPYGLKARDLLRRSGYSVEDHYLATRDETEAFKAMHGVTTVAPLATKKVEIEAAKNALIDLLRAYVRDDLDLNPVEDLAFVLAERLDRRTQDVVALLDAVGTRLPLSELERFRSRAVE